MTEQQIERMVEMRIDALDRTYLNSAMTEADYKAAIREIDQWAAHRLAVWRFNAAEG